MGLSVIFNKVLIIDLNLHIFITCKDSITFVHLTIKCIIRTKIANNDKKRLLLICFYLRNIGQSLLRLLTSLWQWQKIAYSNLPDINRPLCIASKCYKSVKIQHQHMLFNFLVPPILSDRSKWHLFQRSSIYY